MCYLLHLSLLSVNEYCCCIPSNILKKGDIRLNKMNAILIFMELFYWKKDIDKTN